MKTLQVMAGRTNHSTDGHGSDEAIPRWVVGITVVLAVLWATYVLLSGGGRVRQAAVDEIVETVPRESVEILMVRTAASDAPPPQTSAAGSPGNAAALVGPTWVAEDIGSGGVIDDLQSHITFTADGQAHGFGGCSNLTGRYALDGPTLALGPLAGTRKVCPPAIMSQETRFHEALSETRGYRFDNGLLFLLDAQGASVMRLWRRD